jgi:L-serine dehydratase
MRAAADFAARVQRSGRLAGDNPVARVHCVLFGSLGSTGVGHGTPSAIVAGLTGFSPETADPNSVRGAWERLDDNPTLNLAGEQSITFARDDIEFQPRTRLPGHANALTLTATDAQGTTIAEETYFSIGGGFIRRDGESHSDAESVEWPMPFTHSEALMALCDQHGVSIADIALANELAQHSLDEINERLDLIWSTMHDCVTAGLSGHGELPGGLHVQRRAAQLRANLEAATSPDHDTTTEWLHAFALAVNEENAAGGRVVTAPTNGAAGIVPAVAMYALRFVPGVTTTHLRTYLLTATAIGSLFKANASISGAEAGCQGEIGPACAMAAAGLCALLGGTPRQIENAAEIAMEHHLGLTCDPIGGLVQVPCIERNAIASTTAVSAARLALHGDGTHLVSLDAVIETMRQTGLDMNTKYKETSEGGLAVNVIEC